MWVREYVDKHGRFLQEVAKDMRKERTRMVIGRIAQLTDTPSRVMNLIERRVPITELPSGDIVPVAPMFNLYVYRQLGQPRMILTRIDPFHYEHVSLSDREMQLIMNWAARMAADGIGRFTPADGGWFWWRR